MRNQIKTVIQRTLDKFGYKIEFNKDPIIDYDEDFNEIYKICRKYTMTSKERMFALYEAVKYIIKSNIDGDFVECGVWKGGSAMVIAATLIKLGEKNRKIYLYDTFAGMSTPTKDDFSFIEDPAYVLNIWKNNQDGKNNKWCFSNLSEVKKNITMTKYPSKNIKFVIGKVEETIPKHSPNKISLLRLDTDWYESTKHELVHLFPKLAVGGVFIIDDYGRWAGSKKAVDEFFKGKKVLFNRIDYTGRMGLKLNI